MDEKCLSLLPPVSDEDLLLTPEKLGEVIFM
jgi:hypothetical protein